VFQGGGTRLKILEAFAANVPVISTAKGAEGLAVKDGTHCLIAENADEFVDAAQKMWTDQRLATQLAANGLELVKQFYSWEVSSQRITQAIHELGLGGHQA
jgi:glycosyltransferase involved in cell wall biosynthesis